MDVAVRAGVSRATASRVLNGAPNVRRETRERVLSAMAALGYRVDLHARSLATGRSHVLGVLVHNLGNPDDLAIMRALLDRTIDSDLRALVAETRGDRGRRREAVSRWQHDGVDAIVTLPDPDTQDPDFAEQLLRFVEGGGKLVTLGTSEAGLPGAALVLEEYDTAAALGERMARKSVREFFVVAAEQSSLTDVRASGFAAGVRRVRADAPLSYRLVGPDGPTGSEMGSERTTNGLPTTCVFAVDVAAAQDFANRRSGVSAAATEAAMLTTFSYTAVDLPAACDVAAVMPADRVAARALALTTATGGKALRVVGTSVALTSGRGLAC